MIVIILVAVLAAMAAGIFTGRRIRSEKEIGSGTILMKENKKYGRKVSAAALILLLVTALLLLCSACSEETAGSSGSAVPQDAAEKESGAGVNSGVRWSDMEPSGSMRTALCRGIFRGLL